MKTAVDFIAEQLMQGNMRPVEIIAIAKQMEEEQIKNSFDNGYYEGSVGGARKGEYYYNETFKNTDK